LVLLSRADPELVDAQYTKNQAWKSDKVSNACAEKKKEFKRLFLSAFQQNQWLK